MFVERIKRDQDFFTAVLLTLNKVFVKYIVPELLTRNLQSFGTNSLVPPQDNKKETYCTCKQGEFGPMITCDAQDCPILWFHFACVGLTEELDGDWYCDDCQSKNVLNKLFMHVSSDKLLKQE
jgi:hypothetical protein